VTANEKAPILRSARISRSSSRPIADIQLEVLPTAVIGGEHQAPALRPGRENSRSCRPTFTRLSSTGRPPEHRRQPRSSARWRVILPLYKTEIHYIVRADSPLNYLHDIKDAKINGGLVGSGAALITHTLYRMMFGRTHSGSECELPLERGGAGQADRRQVGRCRGRGRGGSRPRSSPT